MSTTTIKKEDTRKTERLHFRLQPRLRSVLERAAAYQGLDLSEFALSVLSREAQAVIEHYELISLSERDRDAFWDMWNDREASPEVWREASRLAAKIDEE